MTDTNQAYIEYEKKLAAAKRHIDADQLAEAAAIYEQLSVEQPDEPDLCHTLGLVYLEQGRLDDAIQQLNHCITKKPDNPKFYRSIGDALQACGYLREALSAYQRACTINPENTDALVNMGNVLHSLNRLPEALDAFGEVIDREPQNLIALNNIGKTYQDRGELQKAIGFYNQCIQIEPSYAEARFNRALALLTLGDYQQGWAEYEWRFRRRNANRVYPHRLRTPRWQGESYQGRRLLVHCEQGLGDVLQFARYLPLVQQLGGTLILEVQRSLLPLFQSMDCIDALIAFSTQQGPSISHDCHIPLLSLAGLFNTTAENVPGSIPYLQADSNHSAQWQGKMDTEDYKIGFVWATSGLDSRRDIPLEHCRSWFKIPGVRFFSLQKGASIHQLAPDLNITDLGNQLSDFRDTAAVVANLDLIISVDTAVAHLAGAMGKPIWVLLPFGADWRWPPDRSTTPWYPTATLFRQDQPGSWRKVQTDVYEALIQKRCNRLTRTTHAQNTNKKRVVTNHGLRKRLFRSTLNDIPGSKYGKSRCQQAQTNNHSNNRIKNVLLISPIYGGSLEVIRYLHSGFLQAGYSSHLQDNSPLYPAYRHIEAMPEEHPDKKNQFDHFLHMIDQDLMASVEKHKPDLVIAIAQSPIFNDTAAKLRSKGIACAYWFVEDYRIRTYWPQKAPAFDYFFTIQKDENLKRHFDTLEHTSWHYLPLACDPAVHKPWQPSFRKRQPYRCQIGFMGAPYSNRLHVFEELVDWDLGIWGEGWDNADLSPKLKACIKQGSERISIAESVKIYSCADIVVNLHSTLFDKGINPNGDFVNPRCFEVAGCGGFQLTDFRKDLPEIFSPGEHIIVFDTISALKELIKFWLSKPDLRKLISQKAQKRVYSEHTYRHRAEEIVRLVER